jgi:hypothetical protein
MGVSRRDGHRRQFPGAIQRTVPMVRRGGHAARALGQSGCRAPYAGAVIGHRRLGGVECFCYCQFEPAACHDRRCASGVCKVCRTVLLVRAATHSALCDVSEPGSVRRTERRNCPRTRSSRSRRHVGCRMPCQLFGTG